MVVVSIEPVERLFTLTVCVILDCAKSRVI